MWGRLIQKSVRRRLVQLQLQVAALAVLGGCVSGAPEAASQAGDARAQGAEQTLCTETNPHPIGESISAKYEIAYEQVMDWFCDGATFEDILLALETHKLTELPVEELLSRADEVGWEQVWAELGLTEDLRPGGEEV